MEISQIMETNIGLLQANAAFFVGWSILLWMMFRGVTNANIYGANTFGKALHSVISLCVVAFFFSVYGNIRSLINNWAMALSETSEELPGGLVMFVERTGATEYTNPSLIPSDPIGLVLMIAIVVGLIAGMWTAPGPKE
ncbi:MAG: hypothetical protein VW905_00225 [Gammaproteobacteria bacterium]|jgi:hypothetical protein